MLLLLLLLLPSIMYSIYTLMYTHKLFMYIYLIAIIVITMYNHIILCILI